MPQTKRIIENRKTVKIKLYVTSTINEHYDMKDMMFPLFSRTLVKCFSIIYKLFNELLIF